MSMTASPAITIITMSVMPIGMSAWTIIITGAAVIIATTATIITTSWAAIAYYLLMAVITSVTGISYAIVIKVSVRSWTAANNLITAIEIVSAATRR
jgi:hypothetical protein